MSFAATAALVALAEAWPQPIREISAPLGIGLLQRAGTALVAGLMISLVAGLATGPFALQHFNRVVLYGLPANLLAEPVSTLLLMPAPALGVVLSPLGLSDLPLAVAGLGIDASAPPWALPAAFLDLLFCCLWRGPLRWMGLPLALDVNLAPRLPAPDLWVAHDAASAAVRLGDAAVFLRPDVRRFDAEVWARRRGLALAPGDPGPVGAGLASGRHDYQPGASGLPVAVIWTRRAGLRERAFREACERAEVIVLRSPRPPGPCRAPVVLDDVDFRRGGSVQLWRRADGGWDALRGQSLRGERPWSAGPPQ